MERDLEKEAIVASVINDGRLDGYIFYDISNESIDKSVDGMEIWGVSGYYKGKCRKVYYDKYIIEVLGYDNLFEYVYKDDECRFLILADFNKNEFKKIIIPSLVL